jgi:hypothetical protein
VDPITAALTITTNSENEGFAIPRIIDGIPLQTKKVNFTTTRNAFSFDPMNCAKMGSLGARKATKVDRARSKSRSR